MPGLDGLRALAVIAVLVYHARPSLLPGGFLGVDLFFVISGFIITRGLLNEWHDRGRIDLRGFWLRRARRLLPAVLLVLLVTLSYAALFARDQVHELRIDVLAALTYVTNWRLILADQSYFDSFQRPSMLRHLWSLAVEEQFYIVWPLVLALGLPILKRRALFVLIIAGIVASALGMALLYDPTGDASRVYYGTDTRAAALLAGAALAFIAGSWRLAGSKSWAPRAMTLAGLASMSLLLGAAVWLDESQPLLYRGGFLAVSLCSALAILAATRPNLFSKALSISPLRWIGVRSYGIYLWHWPIYMLVWPNEPSLGELAAQITAVMLMAAASYQLLEKPVREGALSRLWSRLRAWPSLSPRYRRTAVFSGAGSFAVVFALIAVSLQAKAPEQPPYFNLGGVHLHSVVVASDVGSVVRQPTMMGRVQTAISALTAQTRTCPYDFEPPGDDLVSVSSAPYGPECPRPVVLFQAPAALESANAQGSDADVPAGVNTASPAAPTAGEGADGQNSQESGEPEKHQEPEQEVADATPPPATPPPDQAASPPPPVQSPSVPTAPHAALVSPPSVTAVGDSVMLGAAYTLAGSIPGIDLDAAVGRQASAAVALLQERASAGQLGQVLLIHIGNNGTLTSAQFDQIMQIAAGRRVIFLSLHVPRAWQDGNNAVLQAGVGRYANASLLDWYDAGEQHPELLYTDGIHLTPAGASYYAGLVVAALGG